MSRVVAWSWVVLALLAAHDLTHLLDEGLDTSPGQLALVAIPQWIALAAVMAVVVRGPEDWRQLAALVLGASVVIGFAVIHLVPFSLAAYGDLEPSGVSWLLAWLPTAAGLVLVGIAVRVRQCRAGAAA